MAVTDLTGTKWLFNETLDSSFSGYEWSINFVSNDEGFDKIQTFMSFGTDVTYAYTPNNNTVNAYLTTKDGGGSWSNESYRTIEITGGTDATNSDLIAWLQSNATQIQDESNPISIGNLPIENMYFGTRQVKKVYMGNTLVWEKSTIIEFTIVGISYQAEEGINWGEWCASEYNTGGFVVFNGVVRTSSAYPVVDEDYRDISPSNIIIANYGYLVNDTGGSN